MNIVQVCDGRGGRPRDFGMYLAAVFLSMRKLSFASSIVIRRLVHRGFSVAIRTMSSTILGWIGARRTRFDFQVQNLANPRRCQATTVSGFTIVSVSVQRDQTRASTTQKARSTG